MTVEWKTIITGMKCPLPKNDKVLGSPWKPQHPPQVAVLMNLVTTLMKMFTPNVGVLKIPTKQLVIVTPALKTARMQVRSPATTLAATLHMVFATPPRKTNDKLVVKVLLV